MVKRIFISYRRDDSGGYAIALHNELEKYFGKENVFFDVGDSIKPGANFDLAIRKAVRSSDVLLALIGRNWLTIADNDGRRRLDNPKDYVNIEIATALKHKVVIIPILLTEARMPLDGALPKNLKGLANCQAVEIRHSHFRPDAEILLFALGVGDVMNRIAQSSGQRVSKNEMSINAGESRRVVCVNCGTIRDPDLRIPCPLCGSKKYMLIGYAYAHQRRVTLISFAIVALALLLLIILAGTILLLVRF